MIASPASPDVVIPAAALLEHWQGHRRLTRRLIDAFPDDRFFDFSIGGMRPFSALAMELISMASAGMRGLATRQWTHVSDLAHHAPTAAPATKVEHLRLWDEATKQIDAQWPLLPPHRLEEVDKAFGEYEGPVYALLLYWIDNEIHHRGQAYVYLRALGIEPPAFYDRG